MEPEMSPRTRKLNTRWSEALAAFVAKRAEIDNVLTRLQALSDDHFGYSRDESPGRTWAPWSTTPSS
jgi:hypothetical protein